MQKFDENTVTSRDEIINDFVLESGLPETTVTKMYESFSFVDSSVEYIRKEFKKLLSGFKFNINDFKQAIGEIVIRIKNETDKALREILEKEFVEFVKMTLDKIDDTSLLMEIVSYIIYVTDNKNGKKLVKKLNLPIELTENMNEGFTHGDTPKTLLSNMVPLNESLKYYLSHNNKRWGENNFIENAYVGMMDYLNKEITETLNQNSVTTIDDHFHMDILNQLVKFEQVDPIYRSADNLKKVIPDLQTFMFDLMLIVETYIRDHAQGMDYLRQKTILDYKNGRELLYNAISSSSRSSKLLLSDAKTSNKKEFVNPIQENDYITMQSNDKYCIDWSVLDLFEYRLPINSVFDAIHMIKSISGEFNLNLRPVINNYVSKSIEILVRFKRVIVSKNNL